MLWQVPGPATAEAEVATVFAAASLRGALETVAQDSPVALRLSFGGSGAMARQLAAGAPADLIILANTDWMEWLEGAGQVPPGAAQPITGNLLVVVAQVGSEPLGKPEDLTARLGGDRLAMGHHKAVPAGVYARQWLENTGIWKTLQGQLAETDNVRAALALVSRGQTPLGIVYATDAQADAQVDVVYDVPAAAHDAILYPAAALTPVGDAVLAYLLSPAAQTVFAAQGFRLVQP